MSSNELNDNKVGGQRHQASFASAETVNQIQPYLDRSIYCSYNTANSTIPAMVYSSFSTASSFLTPALSNPALPISHSNIDMMTLTPPETFEEEQNHDQPRLAVNSILTNQAGGIQQNSSALLSSNAQQHTAIATRNCNAKSSGKQFSLHQTLSPQHLDRHGGPEAKRDFKHNHTGNSNDSNINMNSSGVVTSSSRTTTTVSSNTTNVTCLQDNYAQPQRKGMIYATEDSTVRNNVSSITKSNSLDLGHDNTNNDCDDNEESRNTTTLGMSEQQQQPSSPFLSSSFFIPYSINHQNLNKKLLPLYHEQQQQLALNPQPALLSNVSSYDKRHLTSDVMLKDIFSAASTATVGTVTQSLPHATSTTTTFSNADRFNVLECPYNFKINESPFLSHPKTTTLSHDTAAAAAVISNVERRRNIMANSYEKNYHIPNRLLLPELHSSLGYVSPTSIYQQQLTGYEKNLSLDSVELHHVKHATHYNHSNFRSNERKMLENESLLEANPAVPMVLPPTFQTYDVLSPISTRPENLNFNDRNRLQQLVSNDEYNLNNSTYYQRQILFNKYIDLWTNSDVPRDVRSSLVIYGVPRYWTIERLRQLFLPFGRILQYRLDTDSATRNVSRGFIEFDSPEAAATALVYTDGISVGGGRHLKVQPKRYLVGLQRRRRQAPTIQSWQQRQQPHQRHNTTDYRYHVSTVVCGSSGPYEQNRQLLTLPHNPLGSSPPLSIMPSSPPQLLSPITDCLHHNITDDAKLEEAESSGTDVSLHSGNIAMPYDIEFGRESSPSLDLTTDDADVTTRDVSASSPLLINMNINNNTALDSPPSYSKKNHPFYNNTKYVELENLGEVLPTTNQSFSSLNNNNNSKEFFSMSPPNSNNISHQNVSNFTPTAITNNTIFSKSIFSLHKNSDHQVNLTDGGEEELDHSGSRKNQFARQLLLSSSHNNSNDTLYHQNIGFCPFTSRKEARQPNISTSNLLTRDGEIIAENNLFVFHVPPDWDEIEFRRQFEIFGAIRCLKFPKDAFTPWGHRGYGFVCYELHEDAMNAINVMDGKEIQLGRRLKVQTKKPTRRKTSFDLNSSKNINYINNNNNASNHHHNNTKNQFLQFQQITTPKNNLVPPPHQMCCCCQADISENSVKTLAYYEQPPPVKDLLPLTIGTNNTTDNGDNNYLWAAQICCNNNNRRNLPWYTRFS